jgi:predicted HicB family RNase H-like nuclease|tara:strand:- start:64 stop:237 length:174 start_codon:yes stop_codon:yes gene_type:complete
MAPAPKRNQNAAKPAAKRASVLVNFRATPANVKRWKSQAAKDGKSLSAWIHDRLTTY